MRPCRRASAVPVLGLAMAFAVLAGCRGQRLDRPEGGATAAGARRGVPHQAQIVAAAVSRGGDAALSSDEAGEVRLWTALDGSAPPQRLALAGATGLGLARAGDVLLVTAVLPGGLGHLGRHRSDGATLGQTVLDQLAGKVIAVVPTADAASAVVARADQSLELVDAGGQRLDQVRLGRERLRALAPLGDDGVLAVVLRSDDTFVARRYRRRGGELVHEAETALAVRPADGRPVVVAPDGGRLGYHGEVPAPGGGWVASGHVHVVDLATGADVTPPAIAGQAIDGLGFTADGALHVDRTGTMLFTDGGPFTPGTIGRGLRLLAAGGDALLAGHRGALVVEHPGTPPRYLAYRVRTVQRFALSPSGRKLAVCDGPRVAIETLDGSAPDRMLATELRSGTPDLLGFLDDDRLLVTDAAHRTATVFDTTSGAALASAALPDRSSYHALHPRGSWLFGVRPDGWWALALDLAAPAIFGELHALDGPAQRVAPIDDDRAGDLVASTLSAESIHDHSAATIRGRTRTVRLEGWLGDLFLGGDDHGRWYVQEGAVVWVSDPSRPTRTIALPSAERNVYPLPDGGVLVSDPFRAERVVLDLDGRRRWSAAIGAASGFNSAFVGLDATADGRTLAVAVHGGVLLVGSASGAPRHASCAWAFGAWLEPPYDQPPPFSLCD